MSKATCEIEGIVGERIEDAKANAKKQGYRLRVVDDRQPSSCEHRPDRLNVEAEKGRVVKFLFVG